EIELRDQLGEVVRVGVEVVAAPGLARTAVAAAIMGDAAVAARSQEEHLVLEGVRAERPAVAEHDRLSRAPVIEIDLGSVSGRNGAPVRSSFDGPAVVLAGTPTPRPHEVPVMPCEGLLAIVSPAIFLDSQGASPRNMSANS